MSKQKSQELVFLQKLEPRVRTLDIYESFGYKSHRHFKRVINANIERFERQGFLPLESPKVPKNGRPEESYLLNEDQFILLVMLVKNTSESVDLKERVANEFKRLKKALAKQIASRANPEWIASRQIGIESYRKKTDVIAEFVKYAESQGSTNAIRYYSNIAKMQNQALFLTEQKFPNVREFLSIRQLNVCAAADTVIELAIEDGMAQRLNYRDIYQKAKVAVTAFAGIVGKSLIIKDLPDTVAYPWAEGLCG
jgi:phage regulator Rha-like protein